jgi:carbohydrate-binding DOMON domain-containing protein
MSTQYRLVQTGKTASGGCSAGQGSSEPVAPRIYLFILFILSVQSTHFNGQLISYRTSIPPYNVFKVLIQATTASLYVVLSQCRELAVDGNVLPLICNAALFMDAF